LGFGLDFGVWSLCFEFWVWGFGFEFFCFVICVVRFVFCVLCFVFWDVSLGITPALLRTVLRRGEAECLQHRQELARAERVLSLARGLGFGVWGAGRRVQGFRVRVQS